MQFHWVIWLFGGFLVLTGLKILIAPDTPIDPGKNPVVRLVKRLVPVTLELSGQAFFVREGGRPAATPLFLALVFIEVTDVIFAVDSIPAIFAVTTDPYIVFTSNVFAILGLRSLYFLLASFVEKFTYLKPSLAFVLMFVGAKMALVDVFKIHAAVSLAVVLTILTIGVIASILKNRRVAAAEAAASAAASARSSLVRKEAT